MKAGPEKRFWQDLPLTRAFETVLRLSKGQAMLTREFQNRADKHA